MANKGIAGVSGLLASGRLTPSDAYSRLQPLINSAVALLVQIGAVSR